MVSVIRKAQQSIMKFIDIGANLTDLMYTGEYNGSKRHDSDLKVWSMFYFDFFRFSLYSARIPKCLSLNTMFM